MTNTYVNIFLVLYLRPSNALTPSQLKHKHTLKSRMFFSLSHWSYRSRSHLSIEAHSPNMEEHIFLNHFAFIGFMHGGL